MRKNKFVNPNLPNKTHCRSRRRRLVIYILKKLALSLLQKTFWAVWPNRLGWNLVRLCIDLWRIWENCSFVARVLFAKNVFLGSKVCRTSDARNFGSKLVGIGALWPRFSPDRKMTRSGPLFILYDLQLFWLGRSSWFRCQSTGKCPAECRSHRYERMPGLPDPLWPVKLKNGYFWVFM